MSRFKNKILLVLIYDLFVIAVFTILMYFLKEWWLLFMLLGLASSTNDKEEKKWIKHLR